VSRPKDGVEFIESFLKNIFLFDGIEKGENAGEIIRSEN